MSDVRDLVHHSTKDYQLELDSALANQATTAGRVMIILIFNDKLNFNLHDASKRLHLLSQSENKLGSLFQE